MWLRLCHSRAEGPWASVCRGTEAAELQDNMLKWDLAGCNLPYLTTESSLYYVFDAGGQAMDMQCAEGVDKTGSQYLVSLGKDSSL